MFSKRNIYGAKERKERQKTEMREAILSAALNCFRMMDMTQLPMRKIAEEIEYSVGQSIYTSKTKAKFL